MKNIRLQIQETLIDNGDNYTLKTDQELKSMISNFGCGELEFHTADIERLIKEKQSLESEISSLEQQEGEERIESKEFHAIEFASFITIACYEPCDLDTWVRWYDESVPEEDQSDKQYSNEDLYKQFKEFLRMQEYSEDYILDNSTIGNHLTDSKEIKIK
jgi:hypothetical protein